MLGYCTAPLYSNSLELEYSGGENYFFYSLFNFFILNTVYLILYKYDLQLF